ncbi:MAG: sigma factor, partial [Streptosporangiaceae bacterium]
MNPTSATGGLDTFEGERPRLTGLAYRITCSLADAEDVVQEAWIRWAARDAATVDNPAGWLTTVTSRLALDRLRAQRRRREVYVGPWLPDPVPTARNAEETAELAESLTLGFLVLLDSLGP